MARAVKLNHRKNKKYQQSDKVPEAFDILHRHYGTIKEMAIGLGIPVRTLSDWRSKGVPSRFKESIILERAERIAQCASQTDATPNASAATSQ